MSVAPALHGTIAFPVTPWDKHWELDEQALQAHVQRLLASGLEALAFCGSNGELHALSLEDYARISRIAGEMAAGRRYLIFGVGQSWHAAVRQAALARRAGAHGDPLHGPLPGRPQRTGLG